MLPKFRSSAEEGALMACLPLLVDSPRERGVVGAGVEGAGAFEALSSTFRCDPKTSSF
jgi:hypothetical protein